MEVAAFGDEKTFFSVTLSSVLLLFGLRCGRFDGFEEVCVRSVFAACNVVFRNLRPGLSSSFFFRFFVVQLSVSSWEAGATLSRSALVAAACCLRYASSCSAVSFLTASSFARSDSRTESKKSTSSSSRLLNWFFRRMDSSNSACLAAGTT